MASITIRPAELIVSSIQSGSIGSCCIAYLYYSNYRSLL